MKPKLEMIERGIHKRGRRFIVSFALLDGTIERRSVGMVTLEEARRRRLNWMHEVAMSTYQKKTPRKPEPKPQVLTVADLWKAYLVDYKNRGGKDAGRLEIAWMRLEDTFQTVRVADVTTNLVNTYIDSRRAQGVSNATVNREVATLRAAFHHGTRVTPPMVDRVPAFPTRLKESAPRKGFVTDAEYAVLAKNAKPLWLRTLIACAYSFGFRKGELLGLRVSQVDLLDKWITLRQGETKNNEGRVVKMTGEIFTLLVECCRGKKENDYVFTRADGHRVVDPRREWYDLCVVGNLGVYVSAKRANGKEFKSYQGLNLHDFRRSAIRNMTRSGISETVAMKISGHKTASVFRRYDITDKRDLAEATRLIEKSRQAPGVSTDIKSDIRPLARAAKPS